MQAPKWLGECGNYLGVRAGGPDTVLDAGEDYYAPNGGIEEDAMEPTEVEYFPDVITRPPPRDLIPTVRDPEIEITPEIEEVIEVEDISEPPVDCGIGYKWNAFQRRCEPVGDAPPPRPQCPPGTVWTGRRTGVRMDELECRPITPEVEDVIEIEEPVDEVVEVVEEEEFPIEITPEVEEVIATEEMADVQAYEITDPDTGETRIIRVPFGVSPPPGARAVKGDGKLPGWLIPALLALAMAL